MNVLFYLLISIAAFLRIISRRSPARGQSWGLPSPSCMDLFPQWVVLEGIFMGAVHDFTALFVCMREGGKYLAEVARKTMGESGLKLFISFTILMIILVTSSFLSPTSISITSLWPLSKIGVE